jgi:hypothetical protein
VLGEALDLFGQRNNRVHAEHIGRAGGVRHFIRCGASEKLTLLAEKLAPMEKPPKQTRAQASGRDFLALLPIYFNVLASGKQTRAQKTTPWRREKKRARGVRLISG